jgi:hypothetical protein
LLLQTVSPEKDTYMTVLWFKTGWLVSDKVYRKAGQGANGGRFSIAIRPFSTSVISASPSFPQSVISIMPSKAKFAKTCHPEPLDTT